MSATTEEGRKIRINGSLVGARAACYPSAVKERRVDAAHQEQYPPLYPRYKSFREREKEPKKNPTPHSFKDLPDADEGT